MNDHNRVGKPFAIPYFKWSLLLSAAGILAWRIVVLGMAAHYAAQDNGEASATALAWYSHQPHALLEQARALLDTDPARAERLLRQAAWANPADGDVYMTLARLREAQGEIQRAAELTGIASRLAPMQSAVQLQAAAFWLRQGRLDEALTRLSVALRLRSELRPRLYPVLLEFAEDARTRSAFLPLLKEPPDWWEDFFSYAAANADSLDTVKALYYGQRQQEIKPGITQQQRYWARLQQEGQWMELYFTWLNSLDPQQLRALGYIYNGSFELPFTDAGFDWRAPKVGGVLVETGPTYGVAGAKALKVTFQGQRVQFNHLYQYLLLPVGHYRLQGRVRPEGLQAQRGVRWTIACAVDDQRLLGSSEPFLGSDQWRPFVTEFTVPAGNCQVQVLQLVLTGRAALDFEVTGAVWFDDMAIERID